MVSQNRQDTKDRLRGELDFDVNRHAETEIQGLARKLNLLDEKVDDVGNMLRASKRKMSPRPYKLGKRKASIDETRTRILEATRKLLATEPGTADLSMQAIARKADVSRLTIYYQFGSRPGLLEALYDDMASRGNIRQVAEVFQESDANKALEKMARTFVQFWASDPGVIRRIRGMSTLDAEIEAGIHARDARRRHIAGEIIKRFHLHHLDPRKVEQQNLAADVLATLTSFETYDALSRTGHDDAEITQIVVELARAAIGVA